MDYLLYYLYSKPGINRKLALDDLNNIKKYSSVSLNDDTERMDTVQRESEGVESNDNEYFDFDHSLMKNK